MLLRQIAGGIFDIARDVVRFAFGLIELAFRLQLLVAGHLAGGIFDGALCLIGGALDVFAI